MLRRPAASLATLLCAALVSACGVTGPQSPRSLPAPADMHSDLVKPAGSASFAAPAGWIPAPTLATPLFPVPAGELLAAMRDDLLAQPRTWLTVSYPEQEQAFFIVRSLALNLPDIVVVQAVPEGSRASSAVIFSQSRYDGVPFTGANRARVTHLVEMLVRRFGTLPGTASR